MLKAPFPWFGGKSRVADVVWDRFGNVPNYVEPFAGSLAVLLGRPHEPKNETVNDKDAYLANFWRALSFAPEGVAQWADWPVSEADLHARHQWLVNQTGFREKMLTDPEYFDPKIAGWWVWGISQWIGSGWCSRPDWTGRGSAAGAPRGLNRTDLVRPYLNRGGQGVTQKFQKRPILHRSGNGVHRQLPRQDNGMLTVSQQLPHVSSDQGINTREVSNLEAYFYALHDRLRRVRVCCGDWLRILGPSPTTKIGLTAVFLDPPYDMRVVEDKPGRDGNAPTDVLYNEYDNNLSIEVAKWAIEHGNDPLLRIAVCGYEDEHVNFPDSWERLAWKANGGYGNQATQGGRNAGRERIWFSPHCLKPGLFGMVEGHDEALLDAPLLD